MAYSGDFSTSNQYIKFNIEIIPGTANISGNYTPVTVKVWARRTNTGYTTWGPGYVTLTVDGVAHNKGSSSNTHQITITNQNTVYHSWSGNIYHNADGTKHLTVSASIQIPTVLSSSVQSYSINLGRIARVSDFTLSSSSINYGSSLTVNIKKQHSSFTHAVVYVKSNGSTVAIQPWNFGGSSTSYTIPLSDATLIPNSASATGKIQVSTYTGSTLVGTKTKSFTMNLPGSVVPTVSSLTASVVDGYWGYALKGKSRVKLTANGVGGNQGSTVKSVVFSGGGYSSTDASGPWEYTTGVINSSGSVPFEAKVTDSRGRTNKASASVSFRDYREPVFREAWAVRCDSTGTNDTAGTYLKVLIDVDYDTVEGNNYITTEYRYREVGGVWSEYATTTNGINTGAVDGDVSTDVSYEVELKASDYFKTITKLVILNTAIYPIDIKPGANPGVAIGKVAETNGIFDVALGAKFNDGMQVTGTPTFSSNIKANGGIDITAGGATADSPMLYFARPDGTRLAYMDVEEGGAGFAMHTYNLDGSWNSGYRFLNDGTLITRFLTTDSTLTCNGNLQVNGKYISVGKNKMKGWSFTSGSNYWFGLSATDEYARMYTDDIKVVNGKTYLGSPDGRFIKLYATQAVDVSSDRRIKDNITSYNKTHEEFFKLLKPVSYQLKEGHSGRTHFGFIAQDVEEAMYICGLEYKDMAFLQKAPRDANGEEIPPDSVKDYATDKRIVDYNYSLAYTELISLNTHMIQKLLKEVEDLKKEIAALKSNPENKG